jgi:hypothetical protein
MVQKPESKKAAKVWNLVEGANGADTESSPITQQIPSFNGLGCLCPILLWLPHHCDESCQTKTIPASTLLTIPKTLLLALTRPAYARHCGAYRVRKTKAKPATIPAATMMKQAAALGVRRG